ncbi:MAG: undecaprenyl-diphosphate phosphatase [Planctomycetota bacterium]
MLLGILQGLTEFLPVSSSGHLALAQHLGFGGAGDAPGAVAFDILLHVATLLVVVQTFWREIRRVLGGDRIVLGFLALGTLPAIAVGLSGRDFIVDGLRQSPFAVCGALLVTAGFLFACDRKEALQRRMAGLGVSGTLVVGLGQALALVPGVSRSGLTITGGVFAGLSRDEAVRFSFLLMIPAVACAAGYDLLKSPESWRALPAGPAAAGFVAALASGFVALQFVKVMATQRRLGVFVVYLLVAGGGGFLYFALR